MNDPLTQTYAPYLNKAGLKITLPRLLILRTFHQTTKRHLNAADVYKHLNDEGLDIGLATVYRSLMQFAESGILSKHNFDAGKAVFELTATHHHDHLICLRCGKIVEFIDASIEARQEEIAMQHGFLIEDHAMTIYGVCDNPDCRSKPVRHGAHRF